MLSAGLFRELLHRSLFRLCSLRGFFVGLHPREVFPIIQVARVRPWQRHHAARVNGIDGHMRCRQRGARIEGNRESAGEPDQVLASGDETQIAGQVLRGLHCDLWPFVDQGVMIVQADASPDARLNQFFLIGQVGPEVLRLHVLQGFDRLIHITGKTLHHPQVRGECKDG